MALQSQLFRGDAKLEAAAVSDPAHIVTGASGPHVAKIQLALTQLDGADIVQDSAYGPATAAAVSAFKQKRQILNFQGKIDNIVGKKTIAARDAELLAKERGGGGGAGRLGFKIVGDDPRQVNRARPQDIIVQFAGALGAAEGTRDNGSADDFVKKINTIAYLQTHQSVMPICFFGGRGSNDRSTEAVAEVSIVRGVSRNGVTVVLGESSGGLPALKAAVLLTALGIPLNYVAISDGAFFQTLGEVTFIQGQPQILKLGTITADKKDNFFQTFGHNTLRDPRGPGGFMIGTEFHGPLANGFNEVDMETQSTVLTGLKSDFSVPFASQLPLAVRKLLFADRAHVAAGREAEARVERVVRTLIKP